MIFPLYLNTYVMGLRYCIFQPFSAGTVFRRQNLTFIDVRTPR